MATNRPRTKALLPFLKAEKLLKSRYGATSKEIAMWVRLGKSANGLDGYFQAGPHESPKKFIFPYCKPSPDYLVALMDCYFKPADLFAFVPSYRYLTYSKLIEEWSGRTTETKAVALIKAKCASGELHAFHPIAMIIEEGGDQHHEDGDPRLEEGIFWEAQVRKIADKFLPRHAITDATRVLGRHDSKGKTHAANMSRTDERAARRAALASFILQTVELGMKKKQSWAETWDRTKTLPSHAQQFTELFFERHPNLKRQKATTIQADLKLEKIKFTPGKPVKGRNALAILWAGKSTRGTS